MQFLAMQFCGWVWSMNRHAVNFDPGAHLATIRFWQEFQHFFFSRRTNAAARDFAHQLSDIIALEEAGNDAATGDKAGAALECAGAFGAACCIVPSNEGGDDLAGVVG